MKYFVLLSIICCAIYIVNCDDGVREEREPCFCPKILMPLCGSDGLTYNNRCEFDCAKRSRKDLKIIREGRCGETL